MSEHKFSKGPWRMTFDNRYDALCIWDKSKEFLVASIALLAVSGEMEKRRFADFNLISAAPDIYEILNSQCPCPWYIEKDGPRQCRDCKTGKALRKARGEQEGAE